KKRFPARRQRNSLDIALDLIDDPLERLKRHLAHVAAAPLCEGLVRLVAEDATIVADTGRFDLHARWKVIELSRDGEHVIAISIEDVARQLIVGYALQLLNDMRPNLVTRLAGGCFVE